MQIQIIWNLQLMFYVFFNDGFIIKVIMKCPLKNSKNSLRFIYNKNATVVENLLLIIVSYT